MLLNMSAENEHINYSKMSKNWNKLNRPLHTLPKHWSYICIHKAFFSMQKCSSVSSSVGLLGRTPWKQGRGSVRPLPFFRWPFVPVSATLWGPYTSAPRTTLVSCHIQDAHELQLGRGTGMLGEHIPFQWKGSGCLVSVFTLMRALIAEYIFLSASVFFFMLAIPFNFCHSELF